MKSNDVAVIGEREAVLGFKLLGVRNVFMETGEKAADKLKDLLYQKAHDLIIVSEDVRDSLDNKTIYDAENSLRPIVLFMPSMKGERTEESLEEFSKRVLGVDIWNKG